MMTDDDTDMARLDVCFKAARAQEPVPSEALMAAILEDAQREIGRTQRPITERHRFAQQGHRARWRQLVDAIGGWPAMGGLAVASVTGLWIGINAPEFVDGMTGQALSGDPDDFWVDTSAELALGFEEEMF